jgi:thymidylate kinase
VFRNTSKHHLMPALLRRRESGTPVTSPHGSPPRGFVPSVAKLCIWFVDYHVGYYIRIRPQLVRSTLVLFDRYYPDLLVDPVRYRYGGPRRLAAALWWVLPKPDLIIALDAPAELLQQRKHEVSLAETERQRLAFRALVATMPNGHVVDAVQPLDAVIGDVTKILLDHLARRTQQRLRLDTTR